MADRTNDESFFYGDLSRDLRPFFTNYDNNNLPTAGDDQKSGDTRQWLTADLWLRCGYAELDPPKKRTSQDLQLVNCAGTTKALIPLVGMRRCGSASACNRQTNKQHKKKKQSYKKRGFTWFGKTCLHPQTRKHSISIPIFSPLRCRVTGYIIL